MARGRPLQPAQELLEEFEHSCRVTEYLVGVLPPGIWREDPPGVNGRCIAAMAAHLQSVRRTFAKMGGASPLPPTLDRNRSTPAEAMRALAASRGALTKLFRAALTEGRPRVKGMPRRTVNMMIYLMQHDAHHRGQITALARALGHRLSADDVMKMWGWKKLNPV